MQAVRDATTFVLIRHGETDWNQSRRIQGQLDIPLNAVGKQQAQQLVPALAPVLQIEPVVFYTSPLERAVHTLQPLVQALAAPMVQHDALRERHFGLFQGMSAEEIVARHPAVADRWRNRDIAFAPEGGESIRDFAARVQQCLADLAAQHPGQTLVCVTHGGVLDVAYRLAQKIALEQIRDWHIPNAGINQFRYRDGELVLERWAQVTHLYSKEEQTQVEF